MCDTCGCGLPATHTIAVEERLLASNGEAAHHNREHFAAREIFAVNLMGAPGAGKTALLEALIRRGPACARIVVIEGDQATDRDAARIRAAGAAACQVETGLGCHLDAAQVHRALHHLEFNRGDLLFIENVGNLVCPALFDLGERMRILVTTPTEGVDKALKYPPMFRAADIVVLNKCDLIPHLEFDLDQWSGLVCAVNPRATIVRMSAATGAGLDQLIAQLESARRAFLGDHAGAS